MFHLLSILIIAAVLRLYNLTAISLWHDEAFSALLVKYNLNEMMYRIALDVHPPFYYLALRCWDLFFGNSLFSIRMFSVLFGVLIVLGTYLLVKEIFKNNRLALFACLIVAINPFQIQYASEARMYTLGTFLIIFSSYFLLKAIGSTKTLKKEGENIYSRLLFYKNNNKVYWLLYILFASAAIYTHYYIFFSIFAQAIFVFFYCVLQTKTLCHSRPASKCGINSGGNPLLKNNRFRNKFGMTIKAFIKNKIFHYSLITYSLIALLYLPWLKTFLKQTGQVQENYWIPAMNFWSIPNTFYKMTFELPINFLKTEYILAALMLIISAVIISVLKKKKQPAKWLIFFSLIIPFVIASIFSLKTSVYLDRYFIFVSAFYLIFIALGIFLIKNKFIKAIIAAIIIFGCLYGFIYNWNSLDIKNKQGMAGAAAYLNQEVAPKDKIFVGSSFVYFTFRYYNQTSVSSKLYAPGELSHFSGTALLSDEDIIKNFQETKKGEIVWLINTTGFGNFQPEVPPDWIKLEEKSFQDAYDYRGWIIVSKYKI
jgi:uncharacterized membrane protein